LQGVSDIKREVAQLALAERHGDKEWAWENRMLTQRSRRGEMFSQPST